MRIKSRSYQFIVFSVLLIIPLFGKSQLTEPVELPENIHVFDTLNPITVEEAFNTFENTNKSTLTPSTTFGFTAHYYWLKLTLNNDDSSLNSLMLVVNNPHIDLLKAWDVNENGKLKSLYIGGDALPFSARTIKSRTLDIPISISANTQKTILIMADKRNASLSVPLSIMTIDTYQKQVKKSYFLYGVYFGIMFLIILFAFFIFTILKQEIFFWYAFYISFLGLYLMAHVGFLFQLVYPDLNAFNDYSRPVFIAISSAALVHFIRLLLNVKTLLPRFNKFYNAFILVILIPVFWWFVTPFWHDEQTIIILNIQNASLFGSLILVLTSSFLTYNYQKVVVKFFWVAFMAVLLSGMFVILIESGFINEANVSINPLFIGSLIEVLVFAMGLSHWSKVNEENRLRLTQLAHSNKLKMIDSYLNGIESEKQKISSDLHDDIGSSLSHLKRKAEALASSQENVMIIFDGILKKVRTLSHDLAPPIFETDKFLNSVQYLAQAHESETTIINLQVFNTPTKLSQQTTKQLYRVIQNSLAHIEKHAHATSVDVQLFYHENEFTLAIEDNGFSFQYDKNKPSMEIKEMKTRVEILEGVIEISSYSSQGTSIMITIPV